MNKELCAVRSQIHSRHSVDLHSFLRTSNFWADADCSFKNIWRTSASNVIKMFLNMNVSIECAASVDLFHLYKPTKSINRLYYSI